MKKNNSLKVLSSLIGVSGAILLTSNLVQAEEGSSNQSATQSTETVVSDKNEVTAATQSVPTIDGATTTQETAGISEVNNPNINYIKVDETLPLTSETYKRKTATELATMVREKKVTPEELVELAFAEIEKQEAELNALITDKKENGLVEAKARALEEAKNLVDTGQPFLGVPLILKGLGHGIAGGDASNGLYYNGNNTSRGDGTYTRDFKTLGFIPIAQSNYPEYGYRNNTNSYLFGSSRNPWDLSLNSGGSSGGSAAAIASGMVPVASASDSGGSIRIPASWTGLVGYKPSRSAFRTENTSITSHFPITKSVEDAITLYNYYKEKQLKNDSANFSKDTNLKDYKIAYTTKSPMGTDVDPEAVEAVLNQVGFLKSQGFIVEEVEFPVNGRELMRDYTYTMIGGAVSLPRNVDKTKLDPITYGMARVRANLTAAKLGLPPISLIKYETIMSEFHEKYPILLTPTNAHIADKAESWGITEEDKERVLNIDSLPLADQVRLMVNQWEPMLRRTPFTQVFNISGGASISLPTHISDSSFPFGTMYSVKKGDDNILLNLAKYLEDNKQLILKSEIAKKIQAKGTSLAQESKPEIVITSEKGTSLTQETKPEIVIANQKGTSLIQETKPEIVIASGKGTSLTQETKPEIVVASQKGTSLTQETKPEIVIASQKGTSLTQETKPEIVIANEKGTSLTQETKPEIVIASEKGTSLTQETKPEIVIVSQKGTSLTQETKPEIVITSQKGTSLTQESKPEIVIASGKGTSLTQEAKPEIVIASEKGASLTQEKPIYPEWKLLALTAEKPVLEFPTTKIPEQAPTLESKPELVLKTKKGESLIQDTKPQIFVEKQDLKSKQEQVDKEVGKALEKLEKSITKQGQEKSNLDNRVLPKTSAQSSENKNLPLGLGILTLMVAYLTKRSIRK